MVSAHNPLQKKYAIKNQRGTWCFLGEVGGGVCVSCQPIYRSLPCSILFLNFLYKRLREGKDEWASRERTRRGGKSAIMDFISNPLPISQKRQRLPGKRRRVQKRTFYKSGAEQIKTLTCLLPNAIWQHAFCTRTHTHTQSPKRCMAHLLCYFVVLWTVEVMLGQLNAL